MSINSASMEYISSDERGLTKTGWLKSYHSFTFNRYQNPNRDNFGPLMVLNDDIVAPNSGFDIHSHQNMEIITYVLQGRLEHEDSTGGKGTLKAGDLQCMTAGTGIHHSEFNRSKDEPVHLIQIWIYPLLMNLPPSYHELHLEPKGYHNRWVEVVSNIPQPNKLKINQDASLFISSLLPKRSLGIENNFGRGKFLFVVKGHLEASEIKLLSGDGLALVREESAKLEAKSQSELLLFDVLLSEVV